MQALGINTDLAPVADVRSIPNAIEYTRIFGNDPSHRVRTMPAHSSPVCRITVRLPASSIGLGIGSISLDPHEALPTMTRTLPELESTDFATFRALLRSESRHDHGDTCAGSGAGSHACRQRSRLLLVNGVLRGQLGYQGVVMTDSLYMAAISEHYTLPEAAVLSVMAGDDLLEGAYDSYSMSRHAGGAA